MVSFGYNHFMNHDLEMQEQEIDEIGFDGKVFVFVTSMYGKALVLIDKKGDLARKILRREKMAIKD